MDNRDDESWIDPVLDYRRGRYGEGKTASEEAIDSATMLATVILIAGAMLVGIGIGVALTWWWL